MIHSAKGIRNVLFALDTQVSITNNWGKKCQSTVESIQGKNIN
jgi:hypothetical protein